MSKEILKPLLESADTTLPIGIRTLPSRVPYWTDRAWTTEVLDRINEVKDPIDLRSIKRAEQDIFMREMSKLKVDITIDVSMNEGHSEEITMGEARIVREEFHKGRTIKEIEDTLMVSEDLIDRVLSGKVWPYAGGPLRAPKLAGLNIKSSGYTANQRRFIKGVLSKAKRELNPIHFEVLCNNNGMELTEADRLIQDLERSNDRFERYRNILLRHAAGEDVEKCVVAYRRKPRST